jgi:molecular chaperone GrpE
MLIFAVNSLNNNQNRIIMEQNEQPIEETNEINETIPTDTLDNNSTQENNTQNSADEADETQKKRKRGSRGGDGNGQKVKQLETDIEKLTAELGDMKDKYLRLYAEFDNYRKRTSREFLDMQKTAGQSVIKSLLPAIDDFDRAIKIAELADSTETVPTGVKLVYEKLNRALEQQGLQVMETNGEVFNADLHEAITKIPAPTPELKGKVVDTVERGYMLQDKIIRFPKVVVGE